jgi:predicted nucleotidyltransferase component of viral defense system
MLSASFEFSEFIDKVKGRSYYDIIHLADQEATEAERFIYKKCRQASCCDVREYALTVKDFVLYMRYGVMTRKTRRHDMTPFEPEQSL